MHVWNSSIIGQNSGNISLNFKKYKKFKTGMEGYIKQFIMKAVSTLSAAQ